MNVPLEFAFLGLATGGIYTLLGQGLVLIYRGSGTLNFAQGAFATVAAYVFVELHFNMGWPFAPSFVAAVAIVAAIGALTQLCLMRPLRHAAPLARLIATLGVLSVLTGIAVVKYGGDQTIVPSSLPQDLLHFSGVVVAAGQLWLFGIGVVLTAVLYLIGRFTIFGLAMSAVAENQRGAAALGWSPDAIATTTWSAGAALAAVAGILVVPITGLQAENLTLIVIAAMAAALAGNFTSFPLTLLGGLVIGVGQSEMAQYVNVPGLSATLPFFAAILILIVRGRNLPLRSYVQERLPRLGSGRIRPGVIFSCVAFVVILILIPGFPTSLTVAITFQAVAAILLLSLVVLTGYAGQLSLGQFAIAGIGAFIAAKSVEAWHWSFGPALLVGVAVSVPIGLAFGLPALRTRGVNLAVVTLGLGVAVQQIVFQNPSFTSGASEETTVGPANFFGINLDPINHPDRYGIFCVFLLALCSVVVANIRRSRAGRRLVAIRANERVAAALGISVAGAKTFAFGIASALAGLSGILLGFQSYAITYTVYDPLSSISAVGNAMVGGIGYVTGPLAGSGLAQGGIGSVLLDKFGSLDPWLMLIGGISLLLILLLNQDGIVGELIKGPKDPLSRAAYRASGTVMAGARGLWPRRKASETVPHALAASPRGEDGQAHQRQEGHVLLVRNLTVRFGGVLAIDSLDLRVESGEVVGLIGPNGAGKTTAVDAITGLVKTSAGSISLDDRPLDAKRAHVRARAGISRSFQAVELIDDLTVLENLLTASDARDRRAYLSSLVSPDTGRLSKAALAAVERCELLDTLGMKPTELPHGRRRLVGICRAIATSPRMLLLDEPAAGLTSKESVDLAVLIRDLAKASGFGILLIEHDMDVVMNVCDRIIVLQYGRKIAEGSPVQIRNDDQVIAAYLGRSNAEGDGSEQLQSRSVS